MTGSTSGRSALDKDLDKITYAEEATVFFARSRIAIACGAAFLLAVFLISAVVLQSHPQWLLLTAALALGGYMALNIGANDVANNMGPAVGARALTMGAALLIAAVFEGAGALLVGDRVVDTISTGLLNSDAFQNAGDFTLAMLAALVAAAVWVNIATLIGAPVSTTHAVGGGVLGAGIGAVGLGALSGPTLLLVAMSWLVTPLAGALVAAAMLAVIHRGIVQREDRVAAARTWVPVIFAAMAGTFTLYMLVVVPPRSGGVSAAVMGAAVAIAGLGAYLLARSVLDRLTVAKGDELPTLRQLFRVPLAAAAALLSFAHGANDVANAVGPVAAIFAVVESTPGAEHLEFGMSVLAIAALGICLGVLLFGPRLVRMVGERITRLNAVRGFCVVLATAAVVLMASAFGLPVSSTHIAVGAVFGVGFYREWVSNKGRGSRARPSDQQMDADGMDRAPDLHRRHLVRRAHLLTIVMAWVVTVPASAVIAMVARYCLQVIVG
ncbi:MAG: anion permease [Stappia sp.]|uniref:inorganic phosphate transporter n=1 Tax=Stappia sp. TaxID=1870903 RepID=UPI000C61D9F1|nr:inorganic phosphate transporter [Stappia sp.]MBM21489.1 anion permease [Stappia sp.]